MTTVPTSGGWTCICGGWNEGGDHCGHCGRGKRYAPEPTPAICRTPEDAFWAGYNAPCEHGVPNPVDCPDCRLTEAEIGRLAVLLGPGLRAAVAQAA